ncbi:MAG: bacteriohemerythrin [Planctomycetia bacterium]|nr:bacteriohemerythrin [Planctomycetia bacterium]
MAYLEWNENYSVGIKTMDNHHKKLFSIVNELHNGMSSGHTTEVLRKVLSELVDYTKYHFTEEEDLMRKYDYPELASHKEEHDELIEMVQDLQQQFDKRKGELTIIMKMQDFLRSWWVNHIIGIDKKYGPYLNSKGIV